MSELEEAIEAVLVKYDVPALLSDKADRGDLAGAIAETIEATLRTAYLGDAFRDYATGFTGRAVGVWYRIGSAQVQLARVGNDGKIQHEWIDAARLEAADADAPNVGFG